MTTYIANAFSLSMIQLPKTYLRVEQLNVEQVARILSDNNDFGYPTVSAVGHKATAEIISKLIGYPVEMNRIQVKLNKDDELLVFQLLTRLEEGKVLTNEEIEAIPHQWYWIKFFDAEEKLREKFEGFVYRHFVKPAHEFYTSGQVICDYHDNVEAEINQVAEQKAIYLAELKKAQAKIEKEIKRMEG